MQKALSGLLLVLALSLPAVTARAAGPISTVGDLLAAAYGVNNAIQEHKLVTVGTTPVELLLDDSSRFALIVSNQSTGACSVAHVNTVTLTQGFPLAVNGLISENWRDDFTMPINQVWAVCSLAGEVLTIDTLRLP